MNNLYQKYYVNRDYQQLDLYKLLAKKYNIRSVLYPGSYVHISPAFFIPYACFVDMDKKANIFFRDLNALKNKILENPQSDIRELTIKFYWQDYTKPIPEKENSFDLLISQYAGFICEPCKKYIKPNGYLLVNNSHGDAGIAALDKDYTLIGIVNRRNKKYVLSTNKLETYFKAKKEEQSSMEYIHSSAKGIAYTKTASLYLFQYRT